jgi:hypothetical protein
LIKPGKAAIEKFKMFGEFKRVRINPLSLLTILLKAITVEH